MMDSYEIGEAAVFIGSFTDKGEAVYQGMDCEIIDPIGSSFNGFGVAQYGVKFEDGVEMWVDPRYLRKKKPPEEPATWQEIQEISGWNPTKEVIHD